MAYRGRGRGRRRYRSKKALAGKIARKKARATFRTNIKKPKRLIAKAYAKKVGQVTYTAVLKSKRRRRY